MNTFKNGIDYNYVNLPVNDFAPTGLDVDQWLDVIASSGGKYAILTAKWGDGFGLWPTATHVDGYDPYSVAQTTWYANNGSPDIVGLFVASCRAHNILPCLYMGICDWIYEVRAVTSAPVDAAAYTAWIEAQLSELLTNYGDIGAIWFDGWDYQPDYLNISYADILAYIHGLQPNCLVINNSHVHPLTHSEVEVYENYESSFVKYQYEYPQELIRSLYIDAWFYHPDHDQTAATLRGAAWLNADIRYTNDRQGTYTVNITPGTDGHIPAAQVALMAQIHT